MADIFIGTAGWSIPAAYALDFAGSGTHLERYARRMNAAEINSSFYRPHALKTYRRWAASTPAGFRFSVKAPKTITHEHRLVDCGPLAARFAGEVAGLGDKLGVILVQLPPSLAFDIEVAAAFFTAFARVIPAPIACEPRHRSWFTQEAGQILTDLHIARVAADPHPIEGSDRPGGWKGLAYHRLHGSPRMYYSKYDEAALNALRRELDEEAAAGRTVWCIFDNTAEFAALGDAQRLRGL